MPSWIEIQREFAESAQQRNGMADADKIRRKYIAKLSQITGRSTIVYATAWLSKSWADDLSINLQDVHGLMQNFHQLSGPDLDIILHSPGGEAEAVASIVHYLRQKYANIRVFVPLAAMSAATMWALAADRIVMGKHSQLGPIDPQIMLKGPNNQTMAVPAKTILDQFDLAKKEIAENPAMLGAWAPMIPMYGPGLLKICETADALSRNLVKDWLEKYMLAGQENAETKAKEAADFFGNYKEHNSHGMGIFRDLARDNDIIVDNLEDDQDLQDAVLSVFHAILLTFNHTACVKLIENNLGRGLYISAQQVFLQQTPSQQGPSQGGKSSKRHGK